MAGGSDAIRPGSSGSADRSLDAADVGRDAIKGSARGADRRAGGRGAPVDAITGVGAALAVVLLLFLGLPVVALLVRAFIGEAFVDVLSEQVLLDALVLSLVSTLASLAIAVVFGTPLAYLLARRRFRGASFVETLVDLPIVLPPSVAGLALLLLLGRRGALGAPLDALGFEIPFTTIAVVLAQAFVATPFYVRSVRSGFLTIEPEIEDAARVDGAAEWQLIRSISIPLAAPAIATGLVTSWARALGEFGATIMFAGNVEGRTQTLPLLVYSEFQSSLDSSVAAAAILVVAAAGVLLGVRLLRWRSVFDLRALR